MLPFVEFVISIFILFSVTVTNSYLHELRHNESNLLIDDGFGLSKSSSNFSSFSGEARAEVIIPTNKHIWVEQIARKLAPLFSVISFWNEKCWTAGYDQGTCYSRKECIAKRGTPSGMCAAGFGVCCVFSYSCDSASAFNRTYFLNPEFPYTTHEYGTCPHSILKLDDICQIRIDFEVLELARPNKHGYCEEDAFTIQGTDFHMAPLCGDLTGHHLYLPVGYDPKITMQISLLSGIPWARWKIRTTKIKCSSNMLAPPGCQQHLYGTAGRITSFNYFQGEESNMNNLNYGVCVRKERGFCAIQWTLCNHGERKKRSVKSPIVSRFDVQRKTSQVTNSDLNYIPFATQGDGQTKESGFSISRSYAGIHVNRPKPSESVRCWNQRGVPWGSLSNRNSSDQMINCPPEKELMSQKFYSPPPEDVWRPFVPKTNYYVQAEPENPVKLERRTLGIQIESDNIHTWTNSLASAGYEVGGLSQVKDQEPINLSPSSSGMKNSNPSLPIRKYTLQEHPLRAAGSETTYVTTYSNPIPNGNQFVHHQQHQYQHYLGDKPNQHVKSGKDHLEGIGVKVLGIKIPFYSNPRPKAKKVSASASGGIQAGAQVNVDHNKPGHGSWNKPAININHKPGHQIEAGYLPPIHNHPKPVHQPPSAYIPPIQHHPKPVHPPTAGYIPPIHNKPKPDGFPGGGAKPPINVKPKPTLVGGGAGIGAIPPVAVKPKPALGLGSLFTPGKIKVKPRPNKPLTNGGFGLFGRPKVKPKPILQYKPWGHKDKNKGKGNGTCKPKVIVVPVPIPLPIPIPIPIVPVVVVPFPFGGGGGGGGGGGHGSGWDEDDDHHKVISVTEPYIIRIVTDEEREEGLSSFCMDWEQIPCDIWWTQHPKFPSSHNEL